MFEVLKYLNVLNPELQEVKKKGNLCFREQECRWRSSAAAAVQFIH